MIYRPEAELHSRYADVSLARQFDAFVCFDETTAVPEHTADKVPETFPFGVKRRPVSIDIKLTGTFGAPHGSSSIHSARKAMTGNQHPKSKKPSDADIGSDPGIGRSKGSYKEGDQLDQGDNTVEGDVENNTTDAGGINPRQKVRTNK